MYTETDNEFISNLYSLVEAVYYKDYIGGNKEKKKHVDACYKKCKDQVRVIRNLSDSLKFDQIWQFAEFIITAEKVYFYQNVQSSGICCDKCEPLDRVLFFAYDDINTFIKITMQKTNAADKLAIMVYREWGKKTNTSFKVVGRECNFTSDSDLMLANTINAYIQNSIADLYDSYVELAYHGLIYSTVLGDTNHNGK